MRLDKARRLLEGFSRDARGTTAIEYGLIGLFVSVSLIAGATLLGHRLNSVFASLAGATTIAVMSSDCASDTFMSTQCSPASLRSNPEDTP